MPKIRPSDLAPPEAVTYSLGSAEPFQLGGSKKVYETDDPIVLSNAGVHPWLVVEHDAAESYVSPVTLASLPAEQDAFSSWGPNAGKANDPAEAAKVEEAKLPENYVPVAIDAGLDQAEPVMEGPVAETLAAAPDTKTAAKTAKNKE